MKIINKIYFFKLIFKTQCVVHTYSTSSFGPAKLQVLNSPTCPAAAPGTGSGHDGQRAAPSPPGQP